MVRALAHMPEVPGSIPGGGYFQQKLKFLVFVEDTKLSGNFMNFCDPNMGDKYLRTSLCAEAVDSTPLGVELIPHLVWN